MPNHANAMKASNRMQQLLAPSRGRGAQLSVRGSRAPSALEGRRKVPGDPFVETMRVEQAQLLALRRDR